MLINFFKIIIKFFFIIPNRNKQEVLKNAPCASARIYFGGADPDSGGFKSGSEIGFHPNVANFCGSATHIALPPPLILYYTV